MTENEVTEDILKHLSFLVKQDTQNPPRSIKSTDHLFEYLYEHFKRLGFTVEVQDLDDGHVIFYAKKGQPTVLFNVHLDTVPIDSETLNMWQKPPLSLTLEKGRAYGRGCCDIKGAAACLMTVAETAKELAVAFTTDEEGKNGQCVQSFIDGFDLSSFVQVVVAEPTQLQAVVSHRGYLSAQVTFSGISGHSSLPAALKGNAIHDSARWLSKALNYFETYVDDDCPAGLCFNVGSIEGGEKNNMIAESAVVNFSLRIPAEFSSTNIIAQLKNFDQTDKPQWQTTVFPSLPAEHGNTELTNQFCQDYELSIGQAVDFWTEAALFSDAGFPALVLGPGDIAQAHSIDEWVEVSQLSQCYQIYSHLANGVKSHDND